MEMFIGVCVVSLRQDTCETAGYKEIKGESEREDCRGNKGEKQEKRERNIENKWRLQGNRKSRIRKKS